MGSTKVEAHQRYVAEFIGTYLLVFTVGCNSLTDKGAVGANWAVTSIACVLMVSIYALGGVSGGHFNPAVSFACGLAGKAASWSEVAIYSLVQICAGILAGVSYNAAFRHGEAPFTLGPADTFTWLEVMLVETLYTCMLCFVVLNVAATKKAADHEFFGLAIGFVIVAGGYSAGSISGGAFNPAVAFGIDVSSAGTQFGWSFAYLGFELLGAAIAAGLFRIVRPDEYGLALTGDYSLPVQCAAEFIGTFYLCLTVGLCVLCKSPATAWAAAASLMCMIYALGSVSGAHFNPAVTFALVLRGACPAKQAAGFVAAQLLAGIVAACVCMGAQHKQTYGFGPGQHGWGGVAVAEVTFTFVLCFVVLCVCTSERPLKEFYGLAIGSCVTVGGFAVGTVSGGALNPAVALGATIIHAIQGGAFVNGLAFAALELCGGALAAAAFRATHTVEDKVAM